VPEPTATERHRAAVLAGATGDHQTARALLGDAAPRVRAAALGALARAGALDDAALRDALDDADPIVRRRAIDLALPHPGVDLLALLDDPDDTVVEHAAWACGERPPTDHAVDRLATLAIGHRDALVREAAVAALGSLGDERGLPAILHGCRDKATVRRRAVLALAPFDGPEVRAALRTATEDRDWQVRQSAEDLASIMGLDEDGPDGGDPDDGGAA
jgi:HEAT repeat protein